jgi:hypothetical protein
LPTETRSRSSRRYPGDETSIKKAYQEPQFNRSGREIEKLQISEFKLIPEHIYPGKTNALWNLKEVRFYVKWSEENGIGPQYVAPGWGFFSS